jgi:DNA-binding CsgD family transcriptional regulator
VASDLLGRDDELAAGHRLLLTARTGPASLVIEGEPGIGKTALWGAILDEAKRSGFLTLVSSPSEPEVDLSLAALGDILAPVADEVRPTLPEPQQNALDAALVLVDVDSGPRTTDPRVMGVTLLSILRRLCASRPVILAIDDAQWVDSASGRALDFALRRLRDEPIGHLITRRTGAASTFDVRHVALDGSGETVSLRPMSLGALHRLVESRTGISLTRPALGRLERASGGVPLFALDIVRAVRQSGTPMTPGSILPVPVEVDRLIAPRLAALPEATRRLVVAAAAVGRPTLGLLSRLTRRRDVRPVLAPAIDAGLLRMDADRVRFVHPLYQSAVYRAEGTERLRRLHRRLASVLVDPDEAASHRALSADGPDETVAASVAAAADDAQRRGALDTAAALFEHAIRLTAADAVLQRQDRTIALARVCWELGDVERSRALTGEVLQAVGEGRTRAAALVLEGMHVLWSRGAGDAIPIYEEALADVAGDAKLEAMIHLRIGYACDNDASLGASHATAAAALLAGRADGDDLAACALLMSAEQRLMAGHAYDVSDVAAGRAILAQPASPVDARFVFDARAIAYERSWLLRAAGDDLIGARDELAAIRRRDADRGLDRAAPIALMDLADLSCLLGDAGAAREYAAEAVSIAAQTGRLPYADAASQFGEALVAEHEGDLSAASRIASRVRDIVGSMGPSPLLDRCEILLARVELARSRPAVAADGFLRVAARLDQAGVRWAGAHRFRGDLVEALVLTGRLVEADAAASRIEASLKIAPTPWTFAIAARSRALIAAAQSDLASAREHLRVAVEAHESLPLPVERGRTLMLLGRVLRRQRKKAEASDALEAAVQAFSSAGAMGWVARARREVTRGGVRGSGADALTATEREVARLAGAGMTNRQVAEILVLSPKTIDGALTRVYAKLGIHSRAELGSWNAIVAGAKEG